MHSKSLAGAINELQPEAAKLVRDNIKKTEALGKKSIAQLQRLFTPQVQHLDDINPNKGVLFVGYCMDERCSTCGVETACALAGIVPEEGTNGNWAVIKFRFPPYFSGGNAAEEDARMYQAAARLAQRIDVVTKQNPNLEIRVMDTIHPGCGGGKVLHSRGFYQVSKWEDAVAQHHGKFLAEVHRKAERKKHITLDIARLSPDMMQPNIDEHYATACIVGMLSKDNVLRLHPLIERGELPRTYQINGQYICRDPEDARALAQMAALAAQISIRGHALPGLVTESAPFQYIVVHNKQNAALARMMIQELDAILSAGDLARMTTVRAVQV